jgi:hypothetical protein
MPDAVLTGVETRTSSPLRITRGRNRQSLNVPACTRPAKARAMPAASCPPVSTASRWPRRWRPTCWASPPAAQGQPALTQREPGTLESLAHTAPEGVEAPLLRRAQAHAQQQEEADGQAEGGEQRFDHGGRAAQGAGSAVEHGGGGCRRVQNRK